MNREELAWAAGLFDGEGNVTLQGKRLSISVGQVDRRVLDRFREAVRGQGKIFGPYVRKRPSQPYFQFKAYKFEAVQAIIAMLFEFLSPIKREQCARVLRAHSVI